MLLDHQKINWVLPGQPYGRANTASATLSGTYGGGTGGFIGAITGTAGNSYFTGEIGWIWNGLAILHQTRGTNAGQWEIVSFVDKQSGTTTVNTTKPLVYTYTAGAQAILFYEYDGLVLGAIANSAWNGTIGGISVYCGKTITQSGIVTAAGYDYRGYGFIGGYAVGRNTQGYCGEGTAGGIVQQNGANGNGGGGGVGGADAGGGGGGGNGAAGGAGGAQSGHAGGVGGGALGNTGLTNMTFGGAGGSGGGDEDGNFSGTGGSGGGIIIIIGKTITISNYLYAYGAYGTAGDNTNGTAGMGGGGGGAGGSILVCGTVIDMGASKTSLGGNSGGGGGNRTEGYGGAGGGGRIATYYGKSITGTVINYGTYTNEQDLTLKEASGGMWLMF